MIEYEGPLTVHRAYGLSAHLRTLKVGQSCNIPFEAYSISVRKATVSRMGKVDGIIFETKVIRKKGEPSTGMRVTRVK